MSSDESDLTDLDYDEGEIQEDPRQTRNGKGGTAKNGRKVRKVLSKPRTVHYTPQSLFEQIHNGDIDLNPDYQREVVWPETKQSAVVDSFLRHFYVPPVIFSVNVDEDGIEHRTCIDGKQRLTSIVKFMDGMISFRDPFTNEKYWFKENPQAARAHKLLPDKYRKEWGRIQVVCIEYDGLHESEEREIFQRVQMGMALTPSEKLQAISSPKASFVREILATYSELTTDWDSSRGNDFRCVAQALLNIDKYPLKSGGTIMQVEKWLNTEVDLDEDVKDDYRRTFGVFVDLLRDKTLSKCLRTPTTIAPVEFVMICLLIAREKDRLTLAQLSNVILDMRRDVRANHKDIRLNSLVMKTMVTFIGGIKPSKVKGGGGEPAGRKVLSAPKRKLKEDDETGGSKVQKNLEGLMKVQAPTPETGRGPRGSPANGPLASQVKQEAGSGNTFPQPTGDPKISSPRPLTPSIPPVPDRLAAIRSARLGRPPPSGPAADRAGPSTQRSPYPPSPLSAASFPPTPSFPPGTPSIATPSSQVPPPTQLDTSIMARMALPHGLPQYSESPVLGYQDQQGRGISHPSQDPWQGYPQPSADPREHGRGGGPSQDPRQGYHHAGRDPRGYGRSTDPHQLRHQDQGWGSYHR